MKYRYITLPTIAYLLFATAPMHAQPETGMRMPASARSEDQAIRLAMINTVFPVALGYGATVLFDDQSVQKVGAAVAVYGLVVGPSTGNFYANDYLRGGLGVMARFGGALLLQDATTELFGNKFATVLGVDDREVSFNDTGVLIGGALMVGGIAFNIATAPLSAREHNRSMGYAFRMQPIPGTGRTAPVLAARIRF